MYLKLRVSSIFQINKELTLGENIADFDGLDAAFSAYQRYVQDNGQETALPGLEQFSSKQLFFIGSAKVWPRIRSNK